MERAVNVNEVKKAVLTDAELGSATGRAIALRLVANYLLVVVPFAATAVAVSALLP